ncbi:MAG: hypothetical protein H8E55_50705 [Pelagibacterales bacterium]|nr:hypothetical protein [Pelagibacterales bacterium]
MIQVDNATYNEERDGIIPIVAGTYPSHVSGLEAKEITTKAGESKQVFNVTFLIDESVEEMKVSKLVKNDKGDLEPMVNGGGEPITISASFMNGKRFSSTGIWLSPNPPDDKRWQNKRYIEFFESLGVQFPTNKEGDTVLAIIEEEDIIGKPCFVKLGKEFYEKDGEQRSVWKAFSAFPWKDGVALSEDEVTDDLPF